MELNIYIIINNIYDGIMDNYIIKSLNDITINKFITEDNNTKLLFIQYNKKLLEKEDNRISLGYKINEVINDNITNTNWYLININGDIFKIKDYNTVNNNIDTIKKVGFDNIKNNIEEYESKYNELCNNHKYLNRVIGEIIYSSLKDLMNIEIDKNKDNIIELGKENKEKEYENELEVFTDKLYEIINKDDIKIEKVIYNNKEIDVDEFKKDLESHMYPQYYYHDIKSIQNDEYIVKTNYGDIKKSKSLDIYNLNIELLK